MPSCPFLRFSLFVFNDFGGYSCHLLQVFRWNQRLTYHPSPVRLERDKYAPTVGCLGVEEFLIHADAMSIWQDAVFSEFFQRF